MRRATGRLSYSRASRRMLTYFNADLTVGWLRPVRSHRPASHPLAWLIYSVDFGLALYNYLHKIIKNKFISTSIIFQVTRFLENYYFSRYTCIFDSKSWNAERDWVSPETNILCQFGAHKTSQHVKADIKFALAGWISSSSVHMCICTRASVPHVYFHNFYHFHHSAPHRLFFPLRFT